MTQLHRRMTRYCSTYAVLVVLAFSSICYGAPTEEEQKLQQLRKNIEALKKELEATKSNRDDISKALESTEKNINNLSKKAKTIESQLDERKQKRDELRDERSQLLQKKNGQQQLISDYVNAAYRTGEQSSLRLLLNQEDPARVSRNFRYFNYLTEARSEKIASYMATVDRINRIEPEIAFQTKQIEANLKQLQVQAEKLADAQSQRRKLLASLDTRIISQDQELRNLLESRRQLESVIAAVITNIDDVVLEKNRAAFSSLKGKLPWPASGRVSKRFGSNRVTNKMRWDGLLIESDEGDPVKAVHFGRVVFSDYLRGHGLLIIVDHGAGYMSLYAHNQALFKELGEWVDSGDTIAAIGNSGGRATPALYFELRFRGKPTNPQHWLRRA